MEVEEPLQKGTQLKITIAVPKTVENTSNESLSIDQLSGCVRRIPDCVQIRSVRINWIKVYPV